MVSRVFSTTKTWMAVIAVWMMTSAGGRVQADQITGIVSFGDSLSDVGNDYIASGGTQPAPAANYYQGRFTNGGNWLDYLAHDLGVAAPVAALAGGLNYAFGGASTGSGTTVYAPGQAVPNVDSQIAMYLGSHTPTSGQLFTIWAGANNLLIGNQTNPTVPAHDIATEITTLAAAGAKQFLIPNLPLLGEIPASSGLSSAQRQGLDAWSTGFNQTLQAEATSLQKSLGVQIHVVDIQGLVQKVMANPADYGFTNVSGSAINSSLNGKGYLFWDAEHPTTAADGYVAELAAQSVPEPSMLWIFAMSIGFLAATRLRKKVSGTVSRLFGTTLRAES
jgi:phospholipase/lecithinase/hemolysin